MGDATRTQNHPAGILPGSLGEIERPVALDEAPPLPPNAQLEWIGKPVARINGRAKVSGAARFTVDVKLPGMLHGRLLRSPHPHALVRGLDLGAAAKLPGAFAPGAARFAQPLSGNAYKVPIFETLVRRAVLAAGRIGLA